MDVKGHRNKRTIVRKPAKHLAQIAFVNIAEPAGARKLRGLQPLGRFGWHRCRGSTKIDRSVVIEGQQQRDIRVDRVPADFENLLQAILQHGIGMQDIHRLEDRARVRG